MDKSTMAAATTEKGVVEEIMNIRRRLPPRPSFEEVAAAMELITNVKTEHQRRLKDIAEIPKSIEVSDELYGIYQKMQKGLASFQSNEQKREGYELLDLEHAHQAFDELITRASQCVSPNSAAQGRESNLEASGSWLPGRGLFTIDDNYIDMGKAVTAAPQIDDPTLKTGSSSGTHSDGTPIDGVGVTTAPLIDDSTLETGSSSAQDGQKLSMIKLLNLIKISATNRTLELNLQSKISDQIQWIPDSLGMLSSLVTLNLSENGLVELPRTIGGLSSLTSLDLHSNGIVHLSDAIGDLLNLVFLNLSGNQLTQLPSSITRLVRLDMLDLSFNKLNSLPETIGSLVNLKRLNLERNDIEEIPYSIGKCSFLSELRVDCNRLKALPEIVGKMESLEIMSVRYNTIRKLPTSMESLRRLRELDISFNELESVPESLCRAGSLVKLNISNNFTNFCFLPSSIGSLEKLKELDMSNNQIQTLPDSFRALKQLSVLRTDQNPLKEPPRDIADKGAQAAVEYMEGFVLRKEVKAQSKKNRLMRMLSGSSSSKRDRNI